VTALAEFRTLGIWFVSHQEALDTSTPMGKAMFTIIGAMAELERNVIRERVIAGLDYARTHGTKSGRPVGRPKAVFSRVRVIELREAGRLPSSSKPRCALFGERTTLAHLNE
jgi:DNA invertase Pin-like site-specific DNA recombinase